MVGSYAFLLEFECSIGEIGVISLKCIVINRSDTRIACVDGFSQVICTTYIQSTVFYSRYIWDIDDEIGLT